MDDNQALDKLVELMEVIAKKHVHLWHNSANEALSDMWDERVQKLKAELKTVIASDL